MSHKGTEPSHKGTEEDRVLGSMNAGSKSVRCALCECDHETNNHNSESLFDRN
jgi:hypothetical protein